MSSIEIVNGRRNAYGPRRSDTHVGAEIANGAFERENTARIGAEAFADATTVMAANTLMVTLPKGALVEKVLWRSKDSFGSGGTSPTLSITDDSGNACGDAVSAAQMDAGGNAVYDITGTLSAPFDAALADDTPMEIRRGGTSPTFNKTGRGEFVIHYKWTQ